jgi:putative oxidoreductase
MSLIRALETGGSLAERIPDSLVALVSRFAVASVFWRSGQTKAHGVMIKDETFVPFRDEYKVPLLPPDVAAYMSTTFEHLFPVLLIVGFASRPSALGLFGMTMVIQLFVYPSDSAVLFVEWSTFNRHHQRCCATRGDRSGSHQSSTRHGRQIAPVVLSSTAVARAATAH